MSLSPTTRPGSAGGEATATQCLSNRSLTTYARLPWFRCPALLLLDDEEVGVIRRFKPQAQFVRGRGLDVQGKVSIRDGIVGGDRRPAAIDLPDLDSELLRRQVFREVSSHHVIRDHESIAVRLEREEDERHRGCRGAGVAGSRRPGIDSDRACR